MATTTTIICDKCGNPIGGDERAGLLAQVLLAALVTTRSGTTAADVPPEVTSYSGQAHLHAACAADVAALLGALGIKPPTPPPAS